MSCASQCDLRFGRWQDVLSDVECDCLMVDAPYSERTHAGHDAGAKYGNAKAGEPRDNVARQAAKLPPARRKIDYEAWSIADVEAFVASWAPRTRGWFVTITDHVLASVWETCLRAQRRFVFPPIPLVEIGSRVRLSGDGPSCWTCWVVVARPSSQTFARWGTLPGAYIDTPERKPIVGGKHLGLMRALVRDYSRPGDLVCDPCCGAATTLIAAMTEGRRAIGAECLPAHYEIARKRMARGFTPTLFSEQAGRVQASQPDLFDGEPDAT